MLRPFFRVAMLAPGRHRTFRWVAVGHVLLVAAAGYALGVHGGSGGLTILGYLLVALGLVEGAALVGWRLTQLPKSQALEFMLVSPVQPRRLFFAEALVGFSRFALVWLAGAPVFAALVLTGVIDSTDLLPLAIMPFVWGAAAAAILTAWVYEPVVIRRIGEIFALLGVLVYLIVGVLAGENLLTWLRMLPPEVGEFLFVAVKFGYEFNPFGVVQYWFSPGAVGWIATERLGWMLVTGMGLMMAAAVRAACRLKGHFHDRHYKPLDSKREAQLEKIGDRPLSWWAVRRVMEYSGKVNLYLAGGFSLVYAAYLIAGTAWPDWLGKLVFQLVDQWGGAATVATGLCILAVVPAVFQFGLWDSTVQGRCKRLELLLLSDLNGMDYWHASLSAAWRRGWGYLAAAGILWLAMAIGGKATWLNTIATMVGGVALWGFGFAVGFRMFSTGKQTNGLASLFTLGGPVVLFGLLRFDQVLLAGLLPHALCHLPVSHGVSWTWGLCLVAVIAFSVWLTRRGIDRCDIDLRTWFDANQGKKSVE